MFSRFRVQASDKTTWRLRPYDYEKLSEQIARAPNQRTNDKLMLTEANMHLHLPFSEVQQMTAST
jgi:hypothetical protein